MATTDAYKAVINHIKPHPDADRLELAYIGRRECVVKKGQFEVGQPVLYIQSDSQLNTDLEWVQPFIPYISKTGRVRACKLRGIQSAGIIMPYADVPLDVENMSDEDICRKLQIAHYIIPESNKLECLRPSLPYGIEKSDEANYYALPDEQLHFGETALITRKMDGSSAVLYYDPETDNLEVCSRNQSLKLEAYNDYTRATLPYKEQVMFLADYFKSPVGIRGEVCGNRRNDSKVNQDAKKPLGFYMYGVRIVYAEDMNTRFGRWKSGHHFTDINVLLDKEGLPIIPEVPILGEDTITPELLEAYRLKPACDGEGIVINGRTFTYKVKSDDYDSKLG